MTVSDCSCQQEVKSFPPGGPVEFLPSVRTTVDLDGKIVVTIQCVSEASPKAVVSWSKGDEVISNGTKYQISADTTQLRIRDFNVSSFLVKNYTCICRNPLGSQRRDTQLQGVVFSLDMFLFACCPCLIDCLSALHSSGYNIVIMCAVLKY